MTGVFASPPYQPQDFVLRVSFVRNDAAILFHKVVLHVNTVKISVHIFPSNTDIIDLKQQSQAFVQHCNIRYQRNITVDVKKETKGG